MIYDAGIFKFNIFIYDVEKIPIGTGFIKEMIKKYKLNSIYEKIDKLLTYLGEFIMAICDKLEKELDVIVANFNPFTLEFDISTDETDGNWHKITINGIDFNIECEDDTLELLVDLLSREYIEK